MKQDKKTIEKQFEKQLETSRGIMDALKFIRDSETVKKFNGKVFNVRFIRALKEELGESDISLSVGDYYDGERKTLDIYNHDRHYNDEYFTIYVKNYERRVVFELDEGKRFSTKNLIWECNISINHLIVWIEDIEKTLKKLDTMLEDYENVKSEVLEFNKKYNYDIMKYADVFFNGVY